MKYLGKFHRSVPRVLLLGGGSEDLYRWIVHVHDQQSHYCLTANCPQTDV